MVFMNSLNVATIILEKVARELFSQKGIIV